MYKNLRFFNKNGDLTNFSYDEISNKWVGQIDMGLISVDLISSYQLFIMENVVKVGDTHESLTYPIKEVGTQDFIVKFKTHLDDMFIYNFVLDDENSIDVLEKSYQSNLGLIDSNFTLVDNIKNVSINDLNAISINLALHPKTEDSFYNTLLIIDPNQNNHVIAEINLYGESEGEDERLSTMLTNLGLELLPTDVKIFKDHDINEESIDWILLNRKKRELLIEHSNIFPYLGSYKAIINILKYFGYSNIRLKEYWQNVDETTANFGKFKQVDIAQIFTNKPDYIPKELINSKIWNKTNKFGLFYDISIEDEETDERGTPYTKEVFTFTHDEILIKIYALKKKLQQKFLPINAKIVDIVGEAVLFGTYNIGHIPTSNVINFINEELDFSLTCPKTSGYIDDLRYLDRMTETDITNVSELELTENEISIVKEQNWKKSTYFPGDKHVNIGFPLILNVDLDLTWDEAIETYDRVGDEQNAWNTLDLIGRWGLTNLTYEIESASKVFKYVKTLTLFNTPNLEIGVILPYVDTYSVKVTIQTATNYSHVLHKKDFVKVEMFNADLIGFCSQLGNIATWDMRRDNIQSNTSTNTNKEILFDEMSTTWDYAQKPNDEIDTAELSYESFNLINYKQQELDNIHDNAKIKNLSWRNFDKLTWDEANHLNWDSLGTNIAQFDLFSILDTNSTNEIQINDEPVYYISELDNFVNFSDDEKNAAMILLVGTLNNLGGSWSDFIYYYITYYELNDIGNSVLKYNIRAISKNYINIKKYTIKCLTTGLNLSPNYINDMGLYGDVPSSFEIYFAGQNHADYTLSINEISGKFIYEQDVFVEDNVIESIISLSGDVNDFAYNLNNSSDPIISSFTYSIHETKSDINSSTVFYKIIATSKNYRQDVRYEIPANSYDYIKTTSYARPIVKNPTYQDVKIIKYSRELPPYTRAFLTTDNCVIPGKKYFNWTISNTSVANFKDIYLKSNIISFLFTVKGSYDVIIEIEDKNGNATKIIKQELIKII